MQHNIAGFYQPRAVELGLCGDDLLVLRWFVDFAGTKEMKRVIIDDKVYYWISYGKVLEELPILKISKQTLYKKHLLNLCKAGVLEHKVMKNEGNYSYYCYGANYDSLVYKKKEDAL